MVTDSVEKVVTRWTATGTHQGPFMGMPPAGNRFTITGISIHRIFDGKIVEEWKQWDSLGLGATTRYRPQIPARVTAA